MPTPLASTPPWGGTTTDMSITYRSTFKSANVSVLFSSPPRCYPRLTTGASDGLSLMITLGRRLSMSPAKAWTSRILHRIRCAHFHQLYKVAIEDAGKGEESSFFCLSDELLRRHGETPTRRHGKGFSASSAVKDRLVELILLDQLRSVVTRKVLSEGLRRLE